MDRLSLILTFMTGPVLTGVVLITALSLGFYTWVSFALAIAAGLLLSWPVAYYISRRIKKNDPKWDERKVEEVDGIVPAPNAREV